jgi:hypothetical protein
VVLAIVLSACTGGGDIAALKQQNASIVAAMNSLQSQINSDKTTIYQLQAQVAADKTWAQNNFNVLFGVINK